MFHVLTIAFVVLFVLLLSCKSHLEIGIGAFILVCCVVLFPRYENQGSVFTFKIFLLISLSLLHIWNGLKAPTVSTKDHSKKGGNYKQNDCQSVVAKSLTAQRMGDTELVKWLTFRLGSKMTSRCKKAKIFVTTTNNNMNQVRRKENSGWITFRFWKQKRTRKW